MRTAKLILALLFVACFSLATYLQPRQPAREQGTGSSGFLAAALGDGRKLFANEVFAKADAYFHRGNYPSIFDLNARKEENHMSGEAGHEEHEHSEDEHEEHAEVPPPAHDWIERFGQNFRPTVHVHLEKGEEREMLPWLRLSAELDPHSIETYTVASYWLRKRLNKADDAEQFLREGLKANPDDPEILNELAWLEFENKKDFARAENIWKAALRKWHETEDSKKEPNKPVLRAILDGLVQLNLGQNRTSEAIPYLKQLKEISPNPDQVQERIDELMSKAETPASKQ
jgi:tetratricopeptide (TPR) repeat protein